jgi:ADP-ribosylglycohydrolase
VVRQTEIYTQTRSMSTQRLQAVVNSSLWAAAGDALGWITELADHRGVRRRAGRETVTKPLEWRRRIGGKFGPTVVLPAGTYSDDTQLRLAVCRATRGSGDFDVEAFAKIELTVWPSYSLGAGTGTLAAASNLSKSNVAWFSNFHGRGKRSGYFASGGNGAAMRIQPHVWKSNRSGDGSFLSDVIKDAIVSHGHPRGFCGAVFHALCLESALENGDIPGPKLWREFVARLREIGRVVRQDSNLEMFWRSAWETGCGVSLDDAITGVIDEYTVLLQNVADALTEPPAVAYNRALNAVGGFDERTRGSGVGTSLSAVVLAWLHREQSNETALALAANELNSDTDTIASMAGALLGAAQPQPLNWPLQDRAYIEQEARRMASISSGVRTSTYSYPDLLYWDAPSTHSDVVGVLDDRMIVAGFGEATPVGDVWSSGDAQWQWLKLAFGQTILAKRRMKLQQKSVSVMPTMQRSQGHVQEAKPSTVLERPSMQRHPSLPGIIGSHEDHSARPRASNNESDPASMSLDELTDWVIRSDFDATVLGKAMLACVGAPQKHSIEKAIAFTAILAKAVLARKRRQR